MQENRRVPSEKIDRGFDRYTERRGPVTFRPAQILGDNKGFNAHVYRKMREDFRGQNATTVLACSDSRKGVPDYVDIHKSIALGAALDTLNNTPPSDKENIIALCHLNCGGHIARASLLPQDRSGVAAYVRARVLPDPLLQAARVAIEAAKRHGEAAAAWQDHLTLRTRIFLIATQGGTHIETTIDESFLTGDKLYERLEHDDSHPASLPPDVTLDKYGYFLKIMSRQEIANADLARRFSDQNASIATVRPSTVPLPVDFPGTLGRERGVTFKTTFPFEDQVITDEAVQLIAAQLEYPFLHFTNAQSLYVEFPRNEAVGVARELCRLSPVIEEWSQRPTNKIIVASPDEKGVLLVASYLSKTS